MRLSTASLIAVLVTLSAGCEREERRTREPGPAVQRSGGIRMGSLQPGAPQPEPSAAGPYEQNAYAISEGQHLFNAFNCVGCHANGGGGIGPPLMDAFWIYGSEPENIFATIVEGRPNGMPSFRGKIPDYQVWQLVAYVQSLAANAARDAMSARPDHLSAKQPATLQPDATPKPGK